MASLSRLRVAVVLAAMAFALLYGQVFAGLVSDWITDDNYSHGFLIVPLAAYFVWERRAKLATVAPKPSLTGLAVVAFGLLVLVAGVLGADRFLPRASLLLVLTGSILFVCGWTIVRVLRFPLAFLVLMIPLPALIFNQVAFPLQLLASQVGEAGLQAFNIPVLREGNVIVLAHTSLEVAEACSGIRSLVSLVTLGLIFGYFTDPRPPVRAAITLSAVPLAIVTNGLRVAGTGIASHYAGPSAAEGFFHTFSGWLVFVVALGLMFGLTRLLLFVSPTPGSRSAVTA